MNELENKDHHPDTHLTYPFISSSPSPSPSLPVCFSLSVSHVQEWVEIRKRWFDFQGIGGVFEYHFGSTDTRVECYSGKAADPVRTRSPNSENRFHYPGETILNKHLFIRNEMLEHPDDDEVCVYAETLSKPSQRECVRPAILFFCWSALRLATRLLDACAPSLSS